MQDGANMRHDDCPFAGQEPNQVRTQAKFGSGVIASWVAVAVTILITLGGVVLNMGKLTNQVLHVAEEQVELKHGQKQIVEILGNQREILNELENINRRVGDLERKVLGEDH